MNAECVVMSLLVACCAVPSTAGGASTMDNVDGWALAAAQRLAGWTADAVFWVLITTGTARTSFLSGWAARNPSRTAFLTGWGRVNPTRTAFLPRAGSPVILGVGVGVRGKGGFRRY